MGKDKNAGNLEGKREREREKEREGEGELLKSLALKKLFRDFF